MHLSMLSPTTPSTGRVGIRWGFDLVESQIPHPGDELLGQIPYIPCAKLEFVLEKPQRGP